MIMLTMMIYKFVHEYYRLRNTLDILGIDWDRYKQYLEKNFNKHTAKG